MSSKITLLNMDCMDFMADCKDNQFDLAIVDPPYGIDITNQNQGRGGGVAKKIEYKNNNFDKKPPEKKYFDELFRTSKNQIIWGGNYFIYALHATPCFIVWDKDNGDTDFADCELAWCSFKSAVRKYRYKWSGMLQEDMKNKEHRIHPTQKPVALYKWILQKYAKEGDTILDTHLGSGSIAIACYDYGFELTGMELDKEYYDAAVKRFGYHKQQLSLFDT